MGETTHRWAELLERIKTERDELRVHMHLAKAEMRDDWDAMEHRWKDVEAKLLEAGKEVKYVGDKVGDALDVATEEIAEGYRKIRKHLD